MLRRVLLIIVGCAVLSFTGWSLLNTRKMPAAAGPTAAAGGPSTRPTREPAPVAPPAPERGAVPPRPLRRAAAPKEAAPAAEPVAAAALGTLHIESDVAGAQVFIDRDYIGVTPITSPAIALGAHRVNVVAQGYDSIAETVDVEAGPRDLHFNFREVHLDAAVDVVHKHRLGSCKGRLVATPQALRYDSDDKDDRFTLALTELEVFEVDYLAKVLKVKGLKGKRYEFSDPAAANGDRLFVFHRDVDKARQRLKQVN